MQSQGTRNTTIGLGTGADGIASMASASPAARSAQVGVERQSHLLRWPYHEETHNQLHNDHCFFLRSLKHNHNKTDKISDPASMA